MSKELFVFKACPVFITGAQKLSSSELCNCFSNAEDKQKFFAIWVGYLFPVALPLFLSNRGLKVLIYYYKLRAFALLLLHERTI